MWLGGTTDQVLAHQYPSDPWGLRSRAAMFCLLLHPAAYCWGGRGVNEGRVGARCLGPSSTAMLCVSQHTQPDVARREPERRQLTRLRAEQAHRVKSPTLSRESGAYVPVLKVTWALGGLGLPEISGV